MDIVMEVSDRVVVLNQGEIIADDEPSAVRENPVVQEAYLGGYEPGDLEDRTDERADDAPGSGGVA
jgi:branched-chain amino acid transport system ATP-binding protein